MNRILLVILATLCFQACVVKEEKKVVLERPIVDKRVELLAIVFRLAEAPGYSSQEFKLYVDRIEQYFGKYKDHELIQYTRSLVKENGTDVDAVMQMAIRLDDNMKLLTDVNSKVWEVHPGWNKETAEKFASLLPQFVKDTEFDKFFRDNADLYNATVDRFVYITEQVDMNWYSNFFGEEPSDNFSLIIGLGNGASCYGPPLYFADGRKTAYAIMSVWETDNEGMPVYDKKFPNFDTSTLLILLHELDHPHVDPLTEKYIDSFRESGEIILSALKSQEGNRVGMSPYWKTLLDEALVRACVIKYMKDHDFAQSEIDAEIKLQKDWMGLSFIEEVVSELESYDKQRDTYPTFESYMPKLAEFYNALSERI
ncbi:DUF4932 domain-containing protein [Prevotella sp. 10(H)]|uniref:DUF4932 domain-containing protein n=1 Tax=Prevotella sp. 10(H) TaxID=1158294 RepID=UPI00068F1E57|nr:DUF4932 domain-containing protein [Prevotella sp. 10(H)]